MHRTIAKLRGSLISGIPRRWNSSGDLYGDEKDLCKKPPKKIGNLVIDEEEEGIYTCRPRNRKGQEKKRPNCWSGKKGLLVKKHSPVTHVIFNLDGVVLDSEKLNHEAHAMYLSRFKKPFPNELKMLTSGLSEHGAARVLIRELNLNEALPGITEAVYAQGFRQRFRGLIKRIKLMPGVNDLICHLHHSKVPIALASSNTETMFNLKARCYPNLMDRFCHVTLRTDPEVTKGKPYPDIMKVSIRKFKHPPANPQSVLAIEDSIAGARAAKAAGMQVLMIPSRPIPADIATQEADMVVQKLADADLADFSLPAYPQGVYYS
ncbi:haloacid dehalogenase-like hydrolase [Nesidiocoris tenuis]|uniref:Haloacid dehalogenase-like hydrolase n=1 Tax=Nesidiocoris tenuis TaxID=355587 RepID=A0ABN7AWD5_9HEMI|nr:haloacid dehalogenase-like hydrolase [Nesidiocoris tenuis]